MAFVRSDAIRLSNGTVQYAGYSGHVWSRTAYSSTNAYFLYMRPTDVVPSNYNSRYYGFPLRWL